VKPEINSVELHPQLSNKGYPVDDTLVDVGSLNNLGNFWLAENSRKIGDPSNFN
jgi:hypothetical protein